MESGIDDHTETRLEFVLEQILKLAKFDHSTRLIISGNGGEVDAICAALNILAEKLECRTEEMIADKKRIENITAVLLEYTIINFSKRLTLSDRGDDIDAISAGLNTLAEELEASLLAQKKFSEDIEKANKLLIESNEKIQTIFDNTPDAVIAADLDLKITEWNKAAEKMYNCSREEIMGKVVSDVFKTEYVAPYTRAAAVAKMEADGVWSGEIIQTTRAGKKIVIHSSSARIKNNQGVSVGYLAVNRDITEMRKIEGELRESEVRYHLLVNEVLDYAIITLDEQGRITSWNKGAEKIKGYVEKEIIGKHFSIFYSDEDIANGFPQKFFDEAKKEGKVTYSGWRVKKDKNVFWADIVLTKLIDENGNLKGFVKITRDLSEKRKAEEEIAKKTEELKRSNAELEQFAYVASHDLQEPLRTITSYVQLLAKRYDNKLDQDANDFINYAVDGANRMQTLIYSLLDYSRINRIKPFEVINVHEVISEVLKDMESTIQEKGAVIRHDELPLITGDKVLIGQLFHNLIANAIKFKGLKSPEITIRGHKRNGEYLFSVKDNGIGIQKEYREKIFVIFQRLHTKDKFPGTGIGLAICKKIVERHGGKIWVESEIDNGSTFYFTINANLKNQPGLES